MTNATAAEVNVRNTVPFFWVRDIDASVQFYTDRLGFATRHRWVHEDKLRWCWLTLGDAAIMLQAFWTGGPNRNVPESPVGVGVAIYFTCRDALAVYHDVKARGAQPKRPFVGNNMWVVEVADPDGYRLFFTSPTDVAEETEYDG